MLFPPGDITEYSKEITEIKTKRIRDGLLHCSGAYTGRSVWILKKPGIKDALQYSPRYAFASYLVRNQFDSLVEAE